MVVARSSGPRVRAVIGVHQPAEVDVRVALRGGEARVTEQLLDGAQVGARPEGGGRGGGRGGGGGGRGPGPPRGGRGGAPPPRGGGSRGCGGAGGGSPWWRSRSRAR